LAWRKTIPWSLVVFRFLLGPALLLAARSSIAGFWLGAMVIAGFLSDVYDGVLARRWNTASSALRIADSAIDIVFYLGVLAAVVQRHWAAIRDRLWLLVAVIALEILNCVFGLIKFRRMPSYHSNVAKFWGFLLAVSTVAVMSFNSAHWLVTLALAWGIVYELEVFAMSVLLPKWTRDVKTLSRALALRRELLSQSAPELSNPATAVCSAHNGSWKKPL
jgi:CDP-diacylglycerol--glycerol-3-phosphate 3-phosphatidyltransferase